MKKIAPKRILSFSFLHAGFTNTPHVETIFKRYLSALEIDLASELLNHLSGNDLVHLYYSVFQKDEFIKGGYKSSFLFNLIPILQENLTESNQDLVIEYLAKIMHYHFDTRQPQVDMLSNIFDHLRVNNMASNSLGKICNILFSNNQWALAEKLYLKNTAFLDKLADRASIAKLKALSTTFAQSAKPVARESVESLKKENAELIAKNAELKKQLEAAQRTPGGVVKFSNSAARGSIPKSSYSKPASNTAGASASSASSQKK